MRNFFIKAINLALACVLIGVYTGLVIMFHPATFATPNYHWTLKVRIITLLLIVVPLFFISFGVGWRIYEYSNKLWLDSIIFSPGVTLLLISFIRSPHSFAPNDLIEFTVGIFLVGLSILGVYTGLRIRNR